MELIRKAAELITEDVALLRVGKLKVMSHGFEVTEEHRLRLEKVLRNLQAFEREQETISEGPQ